MKHWNVGLCVTPAKMAKLGWGDVSLTKTTKHSCTIRAISPMDLSGSSGAGLDILVFKLTDQFATEEKEDSSKKEIALVQSYLSSHQSVIQIDPISSQRLFSSRDSLCELLLSSSKKQQIPLFETAKYQINSSEGLRFPVLCKPYAACGMGSAHIMIIAFGPKAVEKYKLESQQKGFICQEYINHDALIYKVFCVGNRAIVQKRQSLPNLIHWNKKETEEEEEEPNPLIFDNQKPVGPQIEKWERIAPVGNPRNVDQTELEKVGIEIRKTFGAMLFGVDVIVDSKTGKLVVIDANYFPSYRGCLDSSQFFDLLIDEVVK